MTATKAIHQFPVLPVRIGARLYSLVGLALTMVAILAFAALHFVTLAVETAEDVRRRVNVDLQRANGFELLLERHRRIIETAPFETDRERLADLQRRAAQLISDMTDEVPSGASGPSEPLQRMLPEFASLGDLVLQHAANSAQSAAIDQVKAYAEVARSMENAVALFKIEQSSALDRDLARLVGSGAVMTYWAMAGTAVALFLIGPVSLWVTRRIVHRLKRMTQTMRQLAESDTSVYVSGMGYPDELGDMARALGVFKANAITLMANTAEIDNLKQRFEFALQNMSRALSMFDANRRLIVCNSNYRDLYRLPEALVRPGASFEDIIAYRIATGSGRIGEAVGKPRLPWPIDDPATHAAGQQIVMVHELNDGRSIQLAYQPLADGGWVALHADVTLERKQEQRIEQLAHYDEVTGVANRHYFKERLTQIIEALPASGPFAVHWIDLDRFKAINDTHGHPIGDALLQQVASRLQRAVRSSDFVARLGGDEFAVIQMHARDDGRQRFEAEPLAQRLIKVVSEPYTQNSQRLEIGASIGVVVAPDQGTTADDLIRNADLALYAAKARGRGCHVMFEAALIQQLSARSSLEADLLEAIAHGDFVMHYQPILDLASGEVVACEALMRWTHLVRGPVSPALFIPLAEEIGVINELGMFALRRSCIDAATWPDHVKVAVNLSALQFIDGDLVATVMDALKNAGLPPHRLELEITESTLMRDNAPAMGALEQLRALGISIALDDFGTGYSSLNYLRRFPFDRIKIDQGFIRDMPGHSQCVTIVRAVTELAKSLGITTVAEGVETMDHLERVRAAGCTAVQGYLISRPVPADRLRAAIGDARLRTTVLAA